MNTNGNPTQPNSPGSNDAILASQGLSRLRTLAAISFVVVLGPLSIYAFWRFLGSWGWWRVGNAGSGDEESGRAVNLRRQYVRTWHGWVEDQDGDQGCRDVEARKVRVGQFHGAEDPGRLGRSASLSRAVKSCLRSKAANTDYDRIFWDHRMYEENEPVHPRYWWQKWLNGNTGRCTNRLDEEKGIVRSVSSGFDLGEAGTVRRRPGAGPLTDLWASGSDETRRAIQSQLLSPRKHQRFARGNPRPSSLKVDDAIKAGKDINVPLRHSSLPQRAMLKVQFPTPPLTRHFSAVFRRPRSALEAFSLEKASNTPEQAVPFPQGLLKPRPISGPEVPHNSLESPTWADVTPVSGVQVEKRVALTHTDGSPTLAYETGFANSLGRRLEVWASPMLLDPLGSSDHSACGTAGRRASPAMGWREVQDRPEVLYEDLEGYEAEHSTDQSIQLSDSSSFRGTFDRSLRGRERVVSAGDGVLLTAPALPRDPIIRRSITSGFPNETGRPPFIQPMQRRVSLPHRDIEARTRPDRTLHTSISRAISAGSNLYSRPGRSSPSGGADTCQLRSFTSSERAFLDLMDRKLNWLHHELSPGFRCPEDNPAESFLPISGPGHRKGSNQRAQARVSGVPGSGGASSLPRISRIRQHKRIRYKVSNPKVDSWRIAMNNLRKGGRRTASAELLCAVLQAEEGADQDPVEGTIDTAAWILRRPPQGWPTDPEGDLGTAEKMIVKHQDWEKIRRPQRIMKYRYPGKERSTTQLVRRLSRRVLKALYYGSTTGATGEAASASERVRRATGEVSVLANGNSPELLSTTPRLGLHPNRPISTGEHILASGSGTVLSAEGLGEIGCSFVDAGEIVETQPQEVGAGQVPVVTHAMAGGLGVWD
ncbi:MAG: hypothetical protein M1839_002050 [Geoglossum umbratile]|nr:MAG: hypothetical protein M1839_002050 [Geoglossum umbratile]